MRNKKKTFLALTAATAILNSGAAVMPNASATPSNLKTCEGTDYSRALNIGEVNTEFNKRFGSPNKKGVWQAKDDAAVWDAWCFITGSRAFLDMTAEPVPKIVSDNDFPLAEDGVIVSFHSKSKSGGYTIRLNNKGNS